MLRAKVVNDQPAKPQKKGVCGQMAKHVSIAENPQKKTEVLANPNKHLVAIDRTFCYTFAFSSNNINAIAA
jgi:hypothetical protein